MSNQNKHRRSRDDRGLMREKSHDQDDEICEKCHRRYLENYEHVDHEWIGCDYAHCGKWYHVECMLTKQQHDKLQATGDDYEWHCSEFCTKQSKMMKESKVVN